MTRERERNEEKLQNPEFVAIGASAGGVVAIRRLLSQLGSVQRNYAIGIVQHLPATARLNVGLVYGGRESRSIVEVEDKMHIRSGCIYMASPGYHLLVEAGRTFALSQDDPVLFSRPSIDVFFESVARAYGSRAVGILLTGANADGARGLACLGEAGAFTIVQDPLEAEVATMPKAAIGLRRPSRIWSIDRISVFLTKTSELEMTT